MLSTCQVDHFRAFGLVALPGLLGPERTEALRREPPAYCGLRPETVYVPTAGCIENRLLAPGVMV